MCGACVEDLIETLWNVKSCSYAIDSYKAYGFNRDIVECKEKRAGIGMA